MAYFERAEKYRRASSDIEWKVALLRSQQRDNQVFASYAAIVHGGISNDNRERLVG